MVYMPAKGWIEELNVVDVLGRGHDRVVTRFHERSDCPRIRDAVALRNAYQPHDSVRCTLCASDIATLAPRRDRQLGGTAATLA
jgi:hypothetical protein